jgi:hypothetical protein
MVDHEGVRSVPPIPTLFQQAVPADWPSEHAIGGLKKQACAQVGANETAGHLEQKVQLSWLVDDHAG